MHEKSMRKLEFDKIVRKLSGLSFSEGGRRLCERLNPVSDLELVTARLADTSDAVAVIADHGLPPMQGLHNIRPAVRRALTGATLLPGVLMKVGSFLRAVARLKAQLPGEEAAADNRFYRYMRQLIPLPALEKEIARCILGEDEIADQASPQLAAIRGDIRRTQQSIRRILDDLLRTRASALQENLITMRDNRYVLPVKATHRGEVQGIVHDASSSGATLFIEPLSVIEANNHIRELEGAEREEIERILAELSGLVAASSEELLQNSDLTDEIDFVLAKARLSREMKACCPQLNDRGEIALIQARHPLISPQVVVPIDLRLGKDYRTLIVTGPNTGGKTVSLKTCGLLSLMAMAGLHIPAEEGSLVSVFGNVMADIGDEQSIEQSLSTFSSHMKNLVSITDAADDRMLVLTDELGAGTDPSEGAALAIAILSFLQSKGAVTMATTHYKELKIYALETPGVENACCEFDVDTLMPTYRLLIGVPGVSNAFVIARKLGLNKRIIGLAKEQLSDEGIRFEQVIGKIEKDRTDAAALRQTTELEKAAVERERAALEKERQQFRERKEKELQQLHEAARVALKEQLAEAESLLKQLRLGGAKLLADQAEDLRHQLKRNLKDVEGAIGRQTLAEKDHLPAADEISIGETYYNKRLKINGRVEQGPDSRGQYLFRAGALTAWTEATLLAPAGEGEAAEPAATGGRKRRRSPLPAGFSSARSKAQTFNPEIKLIGLTADEAFLELDRYLDDAVLAGAKSLRIVHGKGSGVLRDMVRTELKRDRRIRSFRAGAYGEGDEGVTIAELN